MKTRGTEVAKKIAKYLLGFLCLIILLAAAFWFQPWSDRSPYRMASTFAPDERVENFRTMDEIYPAATISARTDATPWPGLDATTPLDISYEMNGETRQLSEFLERTTTTGLLVLKDGTAIHEQYLRGETADDQHTSWSVAKSFTSTLIGMLLDDGSIKSLDDPVSTYVPELKGTAYGAASIKAVLQMSSGVAFEERYGRPGSNSAFTLSDAQKILYRSWLIGDSMNELLAAYPALEEPGTRFEYRSGDTHILAWIVEAVTGQPFEQVVQDRIWQPLGMTSDATWIFDGSSDPMPIGFCCLQATLRDFARLGELYRLGGMWNGKRLLSAEWIREATTPLAPHMEAGAATPTYGYGYQWWVPANAEREYLARGIWGQYVWVDEKAGVVIARTSVDEYFTSNLVETTATFRAIVKAVSEEPPLQ